MKIFRSFLIAFLVVIILNFGLLTSCAVWSSSTLNDYEVGDNFNVGIDYCTIKVNKYYFIATDMSDIASLYQLTEEQTKEEFLDEYGNVRWGITPILEGHFTHCYCDDEKMALLEEVEDFTYKYLKFDFVTQEVHYYDSIQELYDEFNITVDDWEPVCNTYEQ